MSGNAFSGARPPRSAVIDLGSNSVRLVVFEGVARNPLTIFNEKATLRLGRGLDGTGRLNEDGVRQAVAVMTRFNAVARGMEAAPFEVLATAAVRDASNGPAFVDSMRELLPGVPIRILSGEEEADYSAIGVLCGLPDADGVMADIGGGSLELVRLENGGYAHGQTLKLGVIRLGDRAGGDPERARAIVEDDLAPLDWLRDCSGRTLYLVGGAFRALARLQIARTAYPLNIVHQFELDIEAAREMCAWMMSASRRTLERLPGAPRRRLDDLPFAAIVLRRLLRRIQPARVVFCVDGLREGWYMRHVAPELRGADPLRAAAEEMGKRLGRLDSLPPALIDWTATLFGAETPHDRRLREAACWMSDTGAYDHPEYRAEQVFLRVLRQPGMAFDHPTRAFLALTLAMRYEAEPDHEFLQPARRLLDPAGFRRAEVLGLALRLAYTVCAGIPELLDGIGLSVGVGNRLVLRCAAGRRAVTGDSVSRRLDRLALALGLQAEIVEA
ncbi:Ppx/GppA family phosphatase [Rhizosaccharibacter radicis]|uniref:Ppx/GppA family phosphatase n=1 Tax=Rhizosaccharibacter radicis TaxID=2782605 RepID=A0ABT1W046_9PROT|nr:Ppx/GppA family phosphatase [Acetobacteraceae bacterium KSS12]